MFKIYDRQSRISYWENFWNHVGRDVDDISSTEVYPLYPTDKYIQLGMKILEAGCGMGRVVKHYGRQGHRIVGFDYAAECIMRLHDQNPDLELYIGDVNKLPHPDCYYDAVLAFGTLSNLEDPLPGLKEFWRVLRPSGLLVASVTNDSLMRRFLVSLDSLKSGQRYFSMIAYKKREWVDILTRSGFEITEIAPVVTRLPMYHYFPWFRSGQSKDLNWMNARDGDRGLVLNPLGEWIFRNAFKLIPFTISHGIVGVCYKKN
ncbi:MAG: class I SAM-dependent methyltransferase [Planctomycetota bacterium]|jgi:ubiquinone/menaquinone biosynthesis C-methylase UbiE